MKKIIRKEKNMKKIISILLVGIFTLNLSGCSKNNQEATTNEELLKASYEELLEDAKGTTINFYGYGGNEVMNKWFDTYVVDEMKEKYDIKVKRIGMNIDEIMNKLLSEKQMNSKNGTVDVVWLNGENFKIAKESDLLFGPFTDKLPNFNNYVDTSAPEINNDFGTNVDNMEAPWGRSQFTIAYNTDFISQPLINTDNLMSIAKANPGKITYPAPPDFTGSAFVRNVIYDIVGYDNIKDLPNDKEEIKKAIQPAINYLNEIKPYLWQQGKSYPSNSSQVMNMYSDNEIYIAMTYTPNTLLGQMESGEIPKSTQIVEFEKGNISNTHFLAIPDNATNKQGAMVLIDFLLSIDAQASKTESKNWGDSTVLDMNKVPENDKSKFSETIEIEKTVPELPASLVPIIEEIWIEEVLESN